MLAGRVFGPRLAPGGRRATASPAAAASPAATVQPAPPAARVVARRPVTGRPVPRRPVRGAWLPVAALAAAGACQLAALGYGAAQPAAADPEQALAGWLAAHGLTSGLGTFTDANLTTLDSGGRVRLRAVSWVPGSPPGWRGARRPTG